MNNHFNHISASKKLKAETLKNAKQKNWWVIPYIAAILVVLIGISVLFIPTNNKNDYKNTADVAIPPQKEDGIFFFSDVAASSVVSDNITPGSTETVLLTPTPFAQVVQPTAVPETTKPPTAPTKAPTQTKTPVTPTQTPPPLTTPVIPTVVTPKPSSSPTLSVSVTATPDVHIHYAGTTMYVTEDNLSVYLYQSTDAPIKSTLTKGQYVTAYKSADWNDWTYIRYTENGTYMYGHVMVKYLSENIPEGATTPPPRDFSGYETAGTDIYYKIYSSSDTSCTVAFDIAGTSEMTFGSAFYVEKSVDGKYEKLQWKNEPYFPSITESYNKAKPEQTIEKTYKWNDYLGSLESGKYRIVTDFYRDGKKITAHFNFTIK